jgi:hypothetical protein
MGDVTDASELFAKAKHQILMRKVWAASKLAFTMASAFTGAAWTARGYLEQLATKDDVAKLLRGQDEKIGNIQASLSMMNDRLTRAEVRVEDIRGTMVIRR